MAERRKGTYVACKYTEESCVALISWATVVGVPNVVHPKDLHSTILYSRAPLEELHGDVDVDFSTWNFAVEALVEVPVRPGAVAPGAVPDHSALALKLKAPELVKLHGDLIALGGTHDFPDYMPHITVSYSVPPEFAARLQAPALRLSVTKVYAEPLNVDWKDK